MNKGIWVVIGLVIILLFGAGFSIANAGDGIGTPIPYVEASSNVTVWQRPDGAWCVTDYRDSDPFTECDCPCEVDVVECGEKEPTPVPTDKPKTPKPTDSPTPVPTDKPQPTPTDEPQPTPVKTKKPMCNCGGGNQGEGCNPNPNCDEKNNDKHDE